MKRKQIMYTILILVLWGGIVATFEWGMKYVQAETAQYTYDSLGRVQTVVYLDGMKMTYVYDKNGNICDVKKEKVTTQQPQKGSGTGEVGKAETPTAGKESSTTLVENVSQEETNTTQNDQNQITDKEDTAGSSALPSATDIKAYNKFKKRNPTIKSLKSYKKKNKRYVKIQIPKLKKVGNYPEDGYQIKYATNKKFKKAKSLTLDRNKKKSLSSKSWTVKKKKTYYVKVRAYMRTKTGKKIYTKYSKVKMVKVK